MSDSKWLAFKNWFFGALANLLPEASKRFVLYELNARVNSKRIEDNRDFWTVTTEEMYFELRDGQ